MRALIHFLFFSFAVHLAEAQSQVSRTVCTYEGLINGKYPISLTLTMSDNLVYGTLVYKKSGLPIRVVGTAESNDLFLNEFDSKSVITGTFSGKITAKGYSGSWFAPGNNATELRFALNQTSRQSAPASTMANLTGTYAFSFGKGEEAPMGKLFVRQLSPDKLIVAIDANRGAPSYNIAIVDKTTIRLRGNQAIYSSREYGKCIIKLTFFDGGASLLQAGSDNECGFGYATSVTGNYVRISRQVPVFPTPY